MRNEGTAHRGFRDDVREMVRDLLADRPPETRASAGQEEAGFERFTLRCGERKRAAQDTLDHLRYGQAHVPIAWIERTSRCAGLDYDTRALLRRQLELDLFILSPRDDRDIVNHSPGFALQTVEGITRSPRATHIPCSEISHEIGIDDLLAVGGRAGCQHQSHYRNHRNELTNRSNK